MPKSSPSPSRGFKIAAIFCAVLAIVTFTLVAGNHLRLIKSSKSTSSLQTLRELDKAVDEWAIEYGKSPGAATPAPAPTVDVDLGETKKKTLDAKPPIESSKADPTQNQPSSQ